MKRVLVTGIGILAPNGMGTENYWEATVSGHTGISTLDRFDVSGYSSTLAGQLTNFNAKELLPGRLLPQTDISTRLALVAAEWALGDAKVDPEEFTDYEMGVVTSTASGGFEFTHREFQKLWSQGSEHVSVYESFAWFYAVNTGQISIRHGMRGPSSALVAEQAGGLDALGHARRTVRRGTTLVVSGGADSALDPWGWTSHISTGNVTRATDPAQGYLPFDERANGYVPGEGGCILICEDADSAAARNAPNIHGEIAGYASTFDPAPGSGLPIGLARAAQMAIADAGLTPADIDVVFADAAGVNGADAAEAEAIAAVFSPRGVPVTAPKSMTGRLYAAGGPLDVATALLSLRDGVVPPTVGTTDVPERYQLDLVQGQPREASLSAALILARGRWGFNSAVVVRR